MSETDKNNLTFGQSADQRDLTEQAREYLKRNNIAYMPRKLFRR